MIKVLVVDDSPTICKIISQSLTSIQDIKVIATACDPYEARAKIIELRPDVITLDIEMPRMNGLTFLEKLMRHYPIPTVILSSFTRQGSETAIRALELGAVDVLCKSTDMVSREKILNILPPKIRLAAATNIQAMTYHHNHENTKPRLDITKRMSNIIIALGASTGGPEAIATIFKSLPENMPSIVIVQHMPEVFVEPFAKRLDNISPLTVRIAQDKEMVKKGCAYLAPGNVHVVIDKKGYGYQIQYQDSPKVYHQKPSVEVLFQSVALAAKHNAIGILLTGMGRDGATGLLSIRQQGGQTITQDETSSIVYGMPKAALECGAAEHVVALEKITSRVVSLLRV